MARPVMVSLWLTLACCALARAADVETLQDFLDIPQRLQDVKGIELLLASQSDPAVGPTNAARVRESFWPLHAAGLDDKAKQAEMARLDAQWAAVARVIRERGMRAVGFVGLDYVLMRQAQDWYFAGITSRGPVLIRLSVQYNGDAPVTVHGMRVWTDWGEVKAASHAIELKAAPNKVLTITYQPKPAAAAEPAKQDPAIP